MSEASEQQLPPMPPAKEVDLADPEWRVFNGLARAFEDATCLIEVPSTVPNRRVIFGHTEDEPSRHTVVLMSVEGSDLNKIYKIEVQDRLAKIAINSALRPEEYTDEAAEALMDYEASTGLSVPNDDELSELRRAVNDIADGIIRHRAWSVA